MLLINTNFTVPRGSDASASVGRDAVVVDGYRGLLVDMDTVTIVTIHLVTLHGHWLPILERDAPAW